MEEIIVIGGGGHAKVVISVLKKLGSFRIIGYVDQANRGDILGVGFMGRDEDLPQMRDKFPGSTAVIGVGGVEISDRRRRLKEKLERLGYALPVVISPSAVVNEEVEINSGTVILDGAVIQSGTRIGHCVIVNTNASIDHDSEIGDFVHVAPGATLSGGVVVGKNSIIGAGSTVIQYRTIAENCVIGAGATVVKDCEVPGVYVGTPARREPSEEFVG